MSAWGDVGTTWGDGPVQPGPRPRLSPRGDAPLADLISPGEPTEDPPPPPHLERALADGLRQLARDLERKTGDGSPFADPTAETLAMLRRAADRLDRPDAEETDP